MSLRDSLIAKLVAALSPLVLELTDESDRHAGHAAAKPEGGTHFHLRLTSDRFTGLSRLERHRLVYDILRDDLANAVHALSLDARAPGE